MAAQTILFIGDDRATQAAQAFETLTKRMNMPWVVTRSETLTEAEMSAASWVVRVHEDDPSAPLPLREERCDRWHLVRNDRFASDLDREVNDLFARLLGGGQARTPGPLPPLLPPVSPVKKEPSKKSQTVKVSRETAGRRGKGVTVITDVPVNEDGLKELAAILKQKCGTGGTVKDGRIEIQGDQRERIVTELEKLGYRAKRAGG